MISFKTGLEHTMDVNISIPGNSTKIAERTIELPTNASCDSGDKISSRCISGISKRRFNMKKQVDGVTCNFLQASTHSTMKDGVTDLSINQIWPIEKTELASQEEFSDSGVVSKSAEVHPDGIHTSESRDLSVEDSSKLPSSKDLLHCKRLMKRKGLATAEMQCSDCSFKCSSNEKLELHRKIVHVEGESFSCSVCGFESKWNKEYYKHMRFHFPGPPYHCDFDSCSAKCDRIQHLLYHRMNHTEERPYTCSFCPMQFKIKSTLNIHMRKHTGYSPFACMECHRSFSTKGALQQHAVTHSEKRAFLCDQCGFSTKHQSHLISHRRIHADDVLHCQLEKCSYKTTKRSQLIAHMQSHLRLKTFFCEECGQGFVSKSHLKRHQLTHAATKPFSCDYCDYSSSRKDKLRLHTSRHHVGENSGSAIEVRPKRKTARSSCRVKLSSEIAETAAVCGEDTAYTTCVKFKKMVQQVDEQVRNRRITKYTKALHQMQQDVNAEGICIDLSRTARCNGPKTLTADEHVIESEMEEGVKCLETSR